MSGCTGGCCALFTLPHSWEELQARDRPLNGSLAETSLIADMVIPLPLAQAQARGDRFGVEVPRSKRLYTCRHWDETTRLCTIYDRRPVMCREYPYCGACDHGCDYVIEDPRVWLRWWFNWHDALPLVSRYSAGMREVERERRRSSRNVRASA